MKFGKIVGAVAFTFAVGSVPAMALRVRPTQQGSWNADQQFNQMDRNRDGVISRGEWTGDAATFNRLDVNRDGVLTPNELRANQNGSWRDRNGKKINKRFRGMDRNGDGVITRDEWRGSDQSFRQLDRNGDGVLSGDELRGNGKFKNDGENDNNDKQDKGDKEHEHDNGRD